MIRISCLLTACLLFVSTASADPYWIAYEGNDFPENEGWTRLWNGPFAERWIEDGSLFIDTRPVLSTCEWYEQHPSAVAPQDTELFVLQWRVKIDEFSGGQLGPSISVFSDDCWAVAFYMNNDSIWSAFECDVYASYEPNVYHEYYLQSSDMRYYELYLDGALAIQGQFWESVTTNKISWGEGTSSSVSVSSWDYVRFGVVPEPSSGVAVLVLIQAFMTRRICR